MRKGFAKGEYSKQEDRGKRIRGGRTALNSKRWKGFPEREFSTVSNGLNKMKMEERPLDAAIQIGGGYKQKSAEK